LTQHTSRTAAKEVGFSDVYVGMKLRRSEISNKWGHRTSVPEVEILKSQRYT